MPETKQTLQAPRWFQLRTVVFSHGWFDLPPFRWDESKREIATAAVLRGAPVAIAFRQPRRGKLELRIHTKGRPTKALLDEAAALTRRIFGWNGDFSAFYRLAGPDYHWARRKGAGPFLRGASVFEDAVKMLATTNCSWSLTRQMITKLVDELGPIAPNGIRAFPSAQIMARKDPAFYRDVIRAGYRSDYLQRFAAGVAEGTIDCEGWAEFQGETTDLHRQIRQVPGLGRYAAENLCKLLGRFDGLGLDSWCLKKFPEVHGPVRGDVGKAIERRYERLGPWKGLALWLDLTRDWHLDDPRQDDSVQFAKS